MVHLVHFNTNNVLNKFGLQNCSLQFWKLYREEFMEIYLGDKLSQFFCCGVGGGGGGTRPFG